MLSKNLLTGSGTPFNNQLVQIKLRLRKKVPNLTANDVRRARIPYYEAITSELYEEGYVHSAYLLLQLIEYEDNYVLPTSDPSLEARRLRYSQSMLDYFRESLAAVEASKQLARFDYEVWQLLAIALKLMRDPEKQWLPDQFFLIAMDRCIDCSHPKSITCDALVRYYYAKYLIQNEKHLEAMKILEYVDACLEKNIESIGQPQIPTGDAKGESLTVAVSTLLFDVNRQLAQDCERSAAWIPEQYIRDAHKAALKTRNPSILAESFFLYGKLQLSKALYEKALEKLKCAFMYAKLVGDKQELLCSVVVAQAVAYHRLKQPVKSEAMFQLVDRWTMNQESLLLSRANYYYTSASLELGDDSIEPERIEWLGDRLRQAAKTFHHFGLEDKTIAALCLEVLVRAEQTFGEYASVELPAALSISSDALYRVIDRVGF